MLTGLTTCDQPSTWAMRALPPFCTPVPADRSGWLREQSRALCGVKGSLITHHIDRCFGWGKPLSAARDRIEDAAGDAATPHELIDWAVGVGRALAELITQNAWAKITQELAAPAAHRRLPTGAGDE